MLRKTNYKRVLALKYLLLQHGRRGAEEKKIQELKSCSCGKGNSTLIPLTSVKSSVQQLPSLLFSWRKNRSLSFQKCWEFKTIFTTMSEVLFCKRISPVSHQWCLHVNKDSEKSSKKEVRSGYPRVAPGPSTQDTQTVLFLITTRGVAARCHVVVICVG